MSLEAEFAKLVQAVDELRQGQQRLWALLHANFGDEQGWFNTSEFAARIERSVLTVRAWCRNKRIVAQKRTVGRGMSFDWEIPRSELERFRNHGLLPLKAASK